MNIKFTIVNVVATAALNIKIDLYELRKFSEILHDSKIYGGRAAYFKTTDMEGKVVIFPSGKMISVGTTSEEKASSELDRVNEFLVDKIYLKPIRLRPKTHNIVVTADLEEKIDLEEVITHFNMIYEPEQFPGGILRFKEPFKATILLFSSGKAVITGLNSSYQIKPIVQKLMNIVKKTNNARISICPLLFFARL